MEEQKKIYDVRRDFGVVFRFEDGRYVNYGMMLYSIIIM